MEIDNQYVMSKYEEKINYYRKEAKINEQKHNFIVYTKVVLAVLVTLLTSITSLELVASVNWLKSIFDVITPLIAAALTFLVVSNPNIHWKEVSRDMAFRAVRLERERERYTNTPSEQKNYEKELAILTEEVVLEETKLFFRRVLDSEIKPREYSEHSLAGDSTTDAPLPPKRNKRK